jgi:hypothetical protein
MEVSEIRRQLRQTIERAKRLSGERRARADEATRSYDKFLAEVATPTFRVFAGALSAEGYPFKVHTPGGGLRLASDRSNLDFIELALDPNSDPPSVVAVVSRGRGSRVVSAERPLRPGTPIPLLTDADLVEFLVTEIEPFVER